MPAPTKPRRGRHIAFTASFTKFGVFVVPPSPTAETALRIARRLEVPVPITETFQLGDTTAPYTTRDLEPGTYALIALGAAVVYVMQRRRRR